QACNDTNCYPFLPNATDANGSATKTLATDSTLVAKLMGEAPAGYTANAEGYPFVNDVATITLVEVYVQPTASVEPTVAPTVAPSVEESVTPTVEPTVAPTADGTILYTVTVVDANGSPVAGVLVVFYDNAFNRYDPDGYTDENGTISISLKPARYLPQVDMSTLPPFSTLPEDVYLTKENPSATLTLGSNAPDGTDYNPFPLPLNEEITVTYNGNTVYYAFAPTASGTYVVTAKGTADTYIGHYGSDFFVSETPIIEDDNSAEDGLNFLLTLSVSENEIGNVFVLGVKVLGEVSLPQTFTISATRTGDYVEPTPLPENEITAQESPKKFPNNTALNQTLVPADLDGTFTVVYNETDGYYHVGSENGPVLLAKLTKTIEEYFSEPLNAWAATQGQIFTFFYEDRKDNYSPLFTAYASTCNEDGVCPVTGELFAFLTEFAKVSSYFGENGWIGSTLTDGGAALQEAGLEGLFACYYYRSSILGGNGTIESPYQIELGTFTALMPSSTTVYYQVLASYQIDVTAANGLTVTVENSNLLALSAQKAGTYSFTVSMHMQGTGAIVDPYLILEENLAYVANLPGATNQANESQLYFSYTASQSGTLLLDAFYKKAEFAVWDSTFFDATILDTDYGPAISVEEGKTYYFIFTLRTAGDEKISITVSYLTEGEAQE
ncbi:MAG: hypothetical protein IIW27_00940, partial [Clostridia bacterium]|nr:hypothetical protein [Clostridia bacterium]